MEQTFPTLLQCLKHGGKRQRQSIQRGSGRTMVGEEKKPMPRRSMVAGYGNNTSCLTTRAMSVLKLITISEISTIFCDSMPSSLKFIRRSSDYGLMLPCILKQIVSSTIYSMTPLDALRLHIESNCLSPFPLLKGFASSNTMLANLHNTSEGMQTLDGVN